MVTAVDNKLVLRQHLGLNALSCFMYSLSCPIVIFLSEIHLMQAIVFYELAFHFNPHCAEACNNLGVIYKDRDNLDKAVECYQASLKPPKENICGECIACFTCFFL